MPWRSQTEGHLGPQQANWPLRPVENILLSCMLPCYSAVHTHLGTVYCHLQARVRNSRAAKGRDDPRAQNPKDLDNPKAHSPGLHFPLPSHWVPHLSMVTVDIVQHMSEDIWGDVMQGDNWGVSRGCRFLALSKVVIQQSPEVVTAATEESLREKIQKVPGLDLPPRS